MGHRYQCAGNGAPLPFSALLWMHEASWPIERPEPTTFQLDLKKLLVLEKQETVLFF
jgi:hypothetical protein